MVRNDHETLAQKVVLEVPTVIEHSRKLLFCCRVATLGFAERYGSVANDSPEAILFTSKDGVAGKLTWVRIQDERFYHWRESYNKCQSEAIFQLFKSLLGLWVPMGIFRYHCYLVMRWSNCCEFENVLSVVETESQETSDLSNWFRYWILAHSWCFIGIDLNDNSNKNVTKERQMLPKKLTSEWIDLQICVFEGLENLSKSLNVFFSSISTDFAIVKVTNCAFQNKADSEFFIRDWKTGRLPVRPIGIPFYLKEANGVLNVV